MGSREILRLTSLEVSWQCGANSYSCGGGSLSCIGNKSFETKHETYRACSDKACWLGLEGYDPDWKVSILVWPACVFLQSPNIRRRSTKHCDWCLAMVYWISILGLGRHCSLFQAELAL